MHVAIATPSRPQRRARGARPRARVLRAARSSLVLVGVLPLALRRCSSSTRAIAEPWRGRSGTLRRRRCASTRRARRRLRRARRRGARRDGERRSLSSSASTAASSPGTCFPRGTLGAITRPRRRPRVRDRDPAVRRRRRVAAREPRAPPGDRELHAFACVGTVTVGGADLVHRRVGPAHRELRPRPLPLLPRPAARCSRRSARCSTARRPRWSLVVPVALVASASRRTSRRSSSGRGSFPLSTDSPIASALQADRRPRRRHDRRERDPRRRHGRARGAVRARRPAAPRTAGSSTVLVVAAARRASRSSTALTFDKLFSTQRPLVAAAHAVAERRPRLARPHGRHRRPRHAGPVSGQHELPGQPAVLARPRVLEQVGALRRPLPDLRRLRRRRDLVPEQRALVRPAHRRGEQRRCRRTSSRASARRASASPASSSGSSRRSMLIEAEQPWRTDWLTSGPLRRRLDAARRADAHPRLRRSRAATAPRHAHAQPAAPAARRASTARRTRIRSNLGVARPASCRPGTASRRHDRRVRPRTRLRRGSARRRRCAPRSPAI